MAIDHGVTAAGTAGGNEAGRPGRRAAAWLAAAAAALWSCAPNENETAMAPTPERLRIVVEFLVPGGAGAEGYEAEGYEEEARKTARRILSRLRPEIRASATVFGVLPSIALEADAAATARLLRMPEVVSVQPDREVTIPVPPGGGGAGPAFRDCAECPEMVVAPAGSFRMGSPPSEEGRDDDEEPMRRVTISEPFAVGKYEVTRGEFASFVSATGRSMEGSCIAEEDGEWEPRSGRGWRSPGFPQTDRDPAVCVSWHDAQAYVAWLSGKTGRSYRLLSESEWEYAARGGTRTSRHWGEGASGQCGYANGADRTAEGRYSGWTVAECDDRHVWTAPVGTFKANGFGLYDMHGNVWEWVADCWNDSYAGAPSDGSVWESGECGRRVLRGGSWSDQPRSLRSADRYWDDTGNRIPRCRLPRGPDARPLSLYVLTSGVQGAKPPGRFFVRDPVW